MGTGVGEMFAMAIVQYAMTEMAKPGIPKVQTPTIAPVVEMPDPLAQKDTTRKKLIEQMQRSGRASTIMTDNTGKLGG